MWFTKAKRAQTNTDNETWIAGGVVPTLNAMDNNGEVFATVLINDGTRVDDVRIYEDGIVPTVISRYGTGGGNVPMVFPIDTRNATRDPDKKDAMNRQGLGLGEDGDPSPTLTSLFIPAVAYPIDDGRDLDKHQNGTGIGNAGDPAYTLDTRQHPTVVAFDTQFGSNANTFEDLSPTLKASQQPPSVTGSIVRRLTPTECERLQGFPDDWTAGQVDSSRYKQMGNAVAVPVVQWIVNRMVADE